MTRLRRGELSRDALGSAVVILDLDGLPIEVFGRKRPYMESSPFASMEAFLRANDNPHGVDMIGLGDPWLIVTIHNPLDTEPSLYPTILRGAFKPSQITDFINREAIVYGSVHMRWSGRAPGVTPVPTRLLGRAA